MWSIERLKLILWRACWYSACSTLIVDIALTLAGASIGWYYGVGVCLTALTVFQVTFPDRSECRSGGSPPDGIRPGDQHLPRPIHDANPRRVS